MNLKTTLIACYKLQPKKIKIKIKNENQPNTKDSKRSNLKSLITNLGGTWDTKDEQT